MKLKTMIYNASILVYLFEVFLYNCYSDRTKLYFTKTIIIVTISTINAFSLQCFKFPHFILNTKLFNVVIVFIFYIAFYAYKEVLIILKNKGIALKFYLFAKGAFIPLRIQFFQYANDIITMCAILSLSYILYIKTINLCLE